MSKNKCGKCGKDPARGFSTINGVRYCHDGPSPTCYERTWYEDMGFGTADELAALASRSKASTGTEGVQD